MKTVDPEPERSERASDAQRGIDPYSRDDLRQIAEALEVDGLSESDEEAIQSAAWIYYVVSIDESGDRNEEGDDSKDLLKIRRQLLEKVKQQSAALGDSLQRLDNGTLRILNAAYLIEEMLRLEARAHRELQTLPKSGRHPRRARHQFVDAFADIYERIKPDKKAGLSKHDMPTGPFYRAVKTALGLIDPRAISGLQHVISDVVKDRKRSD